MNYIIITSINSVTEAIEKYSQIQDWHILVVGDVKSTTYSHYNTTFLNIEQQHKLPYKSITTTPYKHYSRKNIGYLYAIEHGANLIFDTDDDTIPYNKTLHRDFTCETTIGGLKSINPYALFTNDYVWPRGYDLSLLGRESEYVYSKTTSNVGVWQGIIDSDTDVDAIYRLANNKHIHFDSNPDICIDYNCFAPFNTQSTLWNNKLYPLLYIPSSVDFRFTDILRGYVAQRIMWDYGYKVGFHAPNTHQIRNAHNYYHDLLGELTMYKCVPNLLDILRGMEFNNKSIEMDLLDCYKKLHINNIVEESELQNLQNWTLDIEYIKDKK